jgi:hypothetical protein
LKEDSAEKTDSALGISLVQNSLAEGDDFPAQSHFSAKSPQSLIFFCRDKTTIRHSNVPHDQEKSIKR